MARMPSTEQLQGIIDAAHNELDRWRIPEGDEETGYVLTLAGRIAVGLSELAQLRMSCVNAPKVMDELIRMRQQRDALLTALEELEWQDLGDWLYTCPKCGCERIHGHADSCQLGIVLAKARGK